MMCLMNSVFMALGIEYLKKVDVFSQCSSNSENAKVQDVIKYMSDNYKFYSVVIKSG